MSSLIQKNATEFIILYIESFLPVLFALPYTVV